MALTRRDLLGLGTVGGLTLMSGCTAGPGASVIPQPSQSPVQSAPPPPLESRLEPRQVPTPRYTSMSPDDSARVISGNDLTTHLAGLDPYSGGPLRTLRVKPGTYVRTTPVTVPSGVRLIAAGVTFISQIPGADAPLLEIRSVTDVVIEGGNWSGNKAHSLVSEWKHVIRLLDSDRITLDSVVAINAVGDGIYIGSGETPCRDVTIRSVRCTRNGRNGLSITSVAGLHCTDSIFTANGERSPQAGACVEPNHPKAPIEDVKFTRCAFTRNGSRGFLVVMRLQSPAITDSVQLIDCTIDRNANPWGGTMLCGGLVLIRPRGVLVSGGSIQRSHTGIIVQGLRGRDPKGSPRKGTVRLVDVDVHHNDREGLIVLNGIGELTAERVRFFDNSREPAGYFSGIMLAQGADMAFTDCVSTGARMYGLQASDPVKRVMVRQCNLAGNGMGALHTGSAGVTVIK